MVVSSLLHNVVRRCRFSSGYILSRLATQSRKGFIVMADNTRISRDDLESKFRALQADIQGRAADKKQSAIAIGSAVASIVVVLAYLLGRRKGRRRASRVEFRRF
jgi:hypothetical protein